MTIYTLMQLALALGGILLVLVAVQNRALLEKCERLEKNEAALAEALNAATGELGVVRDERDEARRREHDALLACMGLTEELDEFRREESERSGVSWRAN